MSRRIPDFATSDRDLTQHLPLPEPSLMQRTLAILLIEAALIAVIVIAGCSREPTAPKPNPCIHVDTLWVDGKPVATVTAYYSPPNCPKKVLVSSPARSVRGGGTPVTVDEVRQLHVGDHVASPHDLPAYRIRRVSQEPWVSADGTTARISLFSYANGAWIPADAFLRAPGPDTQWRYDTTHREFVRRDAQQRGAA